jgi:transposase-like protein
LNNNRPSPEHDQAGRHRPVTDTSTPRNRRKSTAPRPGLQITIESINARIRRAVNARGHFPTEQAALKCVYLAIMSLDPKGTGQKRWANRWKAALNAFEITFNGRLSAAGK